MRYLLLFLTLQICSLSLYSQRENKYRDLQVLYVDGEAKSCLKKAEKYINKEKSSRDLLPRLYASAANFYLSLREENDIKYPNAFADALDYAGQFYEMSIDTSLYSGLRNSYQPRMIEMAIEYAINHVSDEDEDAFDKILVSMNKLIKFKPNEPGFHFLKAACEFNLNDSSTALKTWDRAEDLLIKIESIETISNAAQRAMQVGLLLSAEYFSENGNEIEHDRIIQLGERLFPEYKGSFNRYQLY